jgi:hypothetical protein
LNNQFFHGELKNIEDVKIESESGREGFPLTLKTRNGFENNEQYDWSVPIKKQKYKLLA